METTLENEIDNNTPEQTDDFSKILGFRDQLLSREILSCGVNINHSVLHFGAGYNNSMLFEYLTEIVKNNLVEKLDVEYTAVDVNQDKINQISNLNDNVGINLETYSVDMQTFLDENTKEFDWTIITGIFDKNLYDENQFHFIDKIVDESLKISKEGIIFTFDSSVENSEDYSIGGIIPYVESLYSRYRVSKINEFNYIICINKYYHSINN